jgi:serralysin
MQSEIKITKRVFEQLERSTGLDFVYDPSGNGELRLGHQNMTVGGYAYYPFNDYNALLVSDDLKIKDTGYGLVTLLHELGHSLGLKHSHENPKIPDNLDINSATVMSYKGLAVRCGPDGEFSVNSSHSLMDILALQNTYGIRTVVSNDIYRADGTLRVVADGGGNDTIDLSRWRYDAKDVNIVDLARGFAFYETVGEWSTASYDYVTGDVSAWVNRSAKNGFYNMIFTKETVIEKVVGSQVADIINGDDADQTILADRGNDKINGRGGDDTLNRGKGRDILIGGAGADTFVYSGGNDVI